jgi:hypothetical protein
MVSGSGGGVWSESVRRYCDKFLHTAYKWRASEVLPLRTLNFLSVVTCCCCLDYAQTARLPVNIWQEVISCPPSPPIDPRTNLHLSIHFLCRNQIDSISWTRLTGARRSPECHECLTRYSKIRTVRQLTGLFGSLGP